jgi:hypothetical protein
MKVKFFGPVTGLCLGLGIAIGCGGSSSDVTGGGADSGVDSSSGGSPDASNADTGTTPSDAGNDVADKDVNIPGTEVSVQYGGCSAFTPCGGDPTGTWTYAAGGCLDAIDVSTCPGATVTNPVIKVKGQVTFTGATAGTVTRLAQVDISASVGIPQSCVNQLPQGFRTCSAIATALKLPAPTGAGFDTATCTASAGGCDCNIAKTQVDNGSETYTVSGNTITTGTGTQRTYDFCVNPASTFTYQETTANAPQTATLVMTK